MKTDGSRSRGFRRYIWLFVLQGSLCLLQSCQREPMQLTIRAAPETGIDDNEKRKPWISLELLNRSSRYIHYSQTIVYEGIDLEIRDEGGARLPPNGRSRDLSRAAHVISTHLPYDLSPGESKSYMLAIGDYASLPTGKNYTIRVKWTFPMAFGNKGVGKDGRMEKIESNVITIRR
jgi:hypothetical protein